jgi:outer membrane receptor protein involved in Fe transport
MRLLLAGTLLSGSIGLAAPAYAQNEDDQQPQTGPVEAAPPVSADAEEENIVVTGSRIPQPNLTATSPVTVINSQEVRLTGTTRAEDLVNSLPQAFAAQSANVSNAATGAATINLRNLGEVRTLVLLNGRRLLPGDPNTSAADINAIPAFMVDRVDVLTGGASSVYGADAVAGVVNFIMDTRFEGIRLDTQYSFYQHNNSTRDTVIAALNNRNFGFPTGNVADGGTWDIGGAFGVGFDDGHGHITVYAGYRHIDPVLQGKRDYSSCALDGTPTAGQRAAGLTEFACGGSATSANGTFFTNVGTFQVGTGRNFIPGTTPYNFAPLNYFQRPDERYTAGLFANYEINESIQPYLEFMYMDDRTVAQIAPSGDFANTTFVNCDNPLQSAQQRGILCQPGNLVGFNAAAVDNPATPVDERGTVFTDPRGVQYNRAVLYLARRNIEGGGRQSTLEHESFRIVAGVRGDLSDAWSYDAFYQFGRVNYNQVYLNDFSATRLRRALDVVTNPAGGAPVCRSVLTGEDPNCVPWDIYAPGQVSAGALAYLQTPGFQRGFTEETVANASLTGQLGEYGIQFPWAENGVGVALGVEYRKEVLDLQTDIAFQTNDLTGQGAAALPVSGQFDVREAFAEARIPIVEHGFIDELALELGYRYSDYGVGGNSFSTDTYKIAGFFAPIRDIRFRGGYNRAVRAPNIQELFAPAVVALDGTTDPCAGAAVGGLVNGLTAAQCARTGVTAAQFGNVLANPAAQYNGLLGGNANLEPEIADTITAGVVIQPRFIPRLALTVDWFDINVKNAIQNLGADNIIASCIASGDPIFCSRITRDARGTLWLTQAGFIRDLNENIGGIRTRGVDIGASWSTPVGSMGTIGFNFQGTWLDKIEIDQGFGVVFDCVGFFGNQCSPGGVLSGPNAEWRHTLRVSWTHPDGYGVTARWRYLGGTDIDDLSDDVDLAGPFIQDGNDRLPSINYIDVALNFRVGDHYNFRLGVNNLLDKEPPVVGQDVCPAGVCNGNTWAGTYDTLGRYIFGGITLDF